MNIRDGRTGSSALIVAIMKDRDETFDELMEAGADVNIVNNTGATALLAAAVRGNVYVTNRLLKANCRINNRARVSDKALMSRLKFRPGHGDLIIRWLFAAGECFILTNIFTHAHGNFDRIVRYIRDLITEKMQLDHLCRESIRSHLLKLDPHQHLFNRISHLGLPEPLRRYLLYGESLDDDSEYGDDYDDYYDDIYDN